MNTRYTTGTLFAAHNAAIRATTVLKRYGHEYGAGGDTILDYWVSDLIADLHHFTDQNGLNWDVLNDTADMHFTTERDNATGVAE